MIKTKLLISGVLAGILVSSTSLVFSQEKEAGSGPNPFTDCGIGGAIFPETGWAAATSNIIWDAGTTGITSATVSPESCNGKKVEAAQFIIDNYNNLAEEAAQGEGEHLTAVLSVFGCAVSSHNTVISSVRTDMGKSVSEQSYTDQDLVEKASNFYSIINSAVDEQSCSV